MRRTFGLWLALVFVISFTLPLLLLSGFFATFFDRMYSQETDRLFQNTLYGISQSISTYISELGRLSTTPYYHADVLDRLVDINQGKYFSSPIAQARIIKDYELSLAQQINTRQDVKGVLFQPINQPDAAFLVQRYAGELRVLAGLNAKDTDWYIGATQANGALFFPPAREEAYYDPLPLTTLSTDADYSMFSVARLIKQTTTLRPLGVMKVDAMDRVIVDLFRHIVVGPHSSLLLLDQADNVIFGVNPPSAELIAQIGDSTRVPLAGDAWHVSQYPVAGTPWRVLYLGSALDLTQSSANIYWLVVLSAASSLLMAAALFYFNSRSSIRAENQILSAMQRIAAGDLSVRLNFRKGSHYETIASSLNQTADQLDAHIQREYSAVLSQRNAEFYALQSQVNPHFLYNILGSFVTLNRIGEKDKLEQLLYKLSGLFRYTCTQQDEVTLAEEFDFLDEYLQLQRLRFSDRLSYRLDCDPAAKSALLPKLLLQPLVENAIVHGLEPLSRPVLIEAICLIAPTPALGRQLVILIRDDAEGFDLRQKAEGRVGLRNVAERLTMFEPRAVFELRTRPGHGCLCALILPLDKEACP